MNLVTCGQISRLESLKENETDAGNFCALGMALSTHCPPMQPSDKATIEARIESAKDVLDEIMATPDSDSEPDYVPGHLCGRCSQCQERCVPGRCGSQGVVTCRTGHGWSAPAFIVIAGGSFGFQIGGQSTDLVLVAVNDKGFQDLLKNKFKIGGDASAAAGPVGRDSQAATDWKLNAELLTYSRAKGLFAGIDLTGAVVDREYGCDAHFYGVAHPSAQILKGEVGHPGGCEALCAHGGQIVQRSSEVAWLFPQSVSRTARGSLCRAVFCPFATDLN